MIFIETRMFKRFLHVIRMADTIDDLEFETPDGRVIKYNENIFSIKDDSTDGRFISFTIDDINPEQARHLGFQLKICMMSDDDILPIPVVKGGGTMITGIGMGEA